MAATSGVHRMHNPTTRNERVNVTVQAPVSAELALEIITAGASGSRDFAALCAQVASAISEHLPDHRSSPLVREAA